MYQFSIKMYKFYKHKLYKKYQDEIWGQIVSSKKFSYNKKAILLHYRDNILKNRFRIRKKFKYFRRGFLKNLNHTSFSFKLFRKNIRLFYFSKKKTFSFSPSVNSKNLFFKRRAWFKTSKTLSTFKFNLLLICSKLNFKKPVLRKNLVTLSLAATKSFGFPFINEHKKRVFYNATKFLRVNNLQFLIKKKLNLRRQKVFFYSVHIAAPKKKTKKWSLFGLKNIYYKKVSLFFGFKKVGNFFKTYHFNKSVFGSNSFAVFLMLEARLENFLMRLNLFPSIYFIKKFIQYGNVFINNKVINYASYNLNFNEIVSINKAYHKNIYYFIKSRLKFKKVFINYPSFIEVDYKLLVATLIRNPDEKSLTKPVSFNLYTSFLSVNM